MEPSISYYQSEADPPLLISTIPEHVFDIGRKFPEQDAVVSLPQGRRLKYRELLAEVDLLARGLIGLGYGKGDAIGIWSTNNIEWLLLQLATARIGAVLVTINPAYRTEELRYALGRSEVKGLFVIPAFRHSNYVEMLSEVVPELQDMAGRTLHNPELPSLQRVVLFEPEAAGSTSRLLPGITVWQDVLAAAEKVAPEDVACRCAALDAKIPHAGNRPGKNAKGITGQHMTADTHKGPGSHHCQAPCAFVFGRHPLKSQFSGNVLHCPQAEFTKFT